MPILIYTIAFIISIVFQKLKLYILSGILLIFCAIFLYLNDYKKNKEYLHLRGIFALGFIGGMGISFFKLSNLATDFSFKTYLTLWTSYVAFYLGYDLVENNFIKNSNSNTILPNVIIETKNSCSTKKFLLNSIIIISALSIICFIIEVIILGFIPLFVINTPHAYSTFHVFALHYIVVLYTLLPSLGFLYYKTTNKIDAIFMYSLILPGIFSLLLVSRSGLVFSYFLLFAVFIVFSRKEEDFYIKYKQNIFKNILFISSRLVLLIIAYILVTKFRGHSAAYLLDVFDLKNKNVPLFIAQPYTYIANNYENFNLLVNNIPKHSYGLKMIYPFWTLSGIKFLFPFYVYLPLYINKAELTTTTIIYDAYYDFGIIGVIFFCLALGILSSIITNAIHKTKNICLYILYAQFFYYLFLSFFSCWFSLPQTYIYFLANIVLIFLYKQFCLKKFE